MIDWSPRSVNLLGTDQFGRDLLTRIMVGGRATLIVGLLSVIFSGFIGIPIGLLSGYNRGRLDEFIMAIADVQLAFPFLLLVLVISFLLGPSLQNTIIALGIAGWVPYARVTRGEVLSIREHDYVWAAKSIGCHPIRIICKHLFPQVITPLIIVATLQMAWILVIESALSFLGMGVQAPTPSWGNMLSEGRVHLMTSWWYATFPGLAITFTVLGLNLIGDWIRDVFDPKSRLRNL